MRILDIFGSLFRVPKPVTKYRLVSLNQRLLTITDPAELERGLRKLTDEQYQQYKDCRDRKRYNIDNLGYYLRERFDEMKRGNYKRDFILEIVNKFRLTHQFGGNHENILKKRQGGQK